MVSTKTKPWYLSKGVMGSAGAIIAGILGLWYSDIKADDVTNVLIAAGGTISAVVALWGRLSAKDKIG